MRGIRVIPPLGLLILVVAVVVVECVVVVASMFACGSVVSSMRVCESSLTPHDDEDEDEDASSVNWLESGLVAEGLVEAFVSTIRSPGSPWMQ